MNGGDTPFINTMFNPKEMDRNKNKQMGTDKMNELQNSQLNPKCFK